MKLGLAVIGALVLGAVLFRGFYAILAEKAAKVEKDLEDLDNSDRKDNTPMSNGPIAAVALFATVAVNKLFEAVNRKELIRI